MNSKMIMVLAMVVIMSGSAVALAGAYAATPPAPVVKNIGNYTFDYYGNGTITNVSYSGSDSAGSVILANEVTASGSNISSSVMFPKMQDNPAPFSIKNMTFLSGQDSNTLIMMTEPSGGQAKQVFTFNGTVTKISGTFDMQSSDSFSGMFSTQAGMSLSSPFTLYELSNQNFSGYFISNGATQTLASSYNSISVSSTSGVLISGFVASGNLKDIMEKYMHEHDYGNRFTYNTSTGNVTGRFVNFNFNNETGVISNYSANGSYHTLIFNSIASSGNGSIGNASMFPAFRTGIPMTYGSLFFYANSSYIYTAHDNPALQLDMILNNGTMKLNISSSLTITNLSRIGGVASPQVHMNATTVTQNLSTQDGAQLELEQQFQRGTYLYYIHNSTFRGMLGISGGNVTFNATDNIITIKTAEVAMVHFLAPPGLNRVPAGIFSHVEYAMEKGRVAAQVAIDSLNNTAVNYTMMLNNSVSMKINSIANGKIQIAVGSSEHAGTNLVFFINQSYMNSGKVYVYFDGHLANLSSSIGTAINATSSTSAYYGYEQVNGGYLVVIHVPHFSNHTITITDSIISSSSGPSPLPLSALDLAIIAVVVVAVIAGIVLAVRKK